MDLNFLNRLKILLHTEKSIQRTKESVAKPILSDTSLLSVVYEIYQAVPQDIVTFGKLMPKRKFVFLAACLYSPECIVGGRMARGLRNVIAEVLGASHYMVTRWLDEITQYCDVYESLRKEVGEEFAYLTEQLKERGLIDEQRD